LNRADFGISKKFAAGEFSQTAGAMAGTRKYCAPEVYQEESRGRSADVFSLGCVFLEIFTVAQGISLDEFAEFRSHIIDHLDEERDYSFHGNLDKVSQWIDKLSVMSVTDPMQNEVKSECIEPGWKQGTIRRMLLWNPEDRPTASTVLQELGGPRDCCVQAREVFEEELLKEPPQSFQRRHLSHG
jgi:serine/threonine protein kinase